jgi:hypothetical protein
MSGCPKNPLLPLTEQERAGTVKNWKRSSSRPGYTSLKALIEPAYKFSEHMSTRTLPKPPRRSAPLCYNYLKKYQCWIRAESRYELCDHLTQVYYGV